MPRHYTELDPPLRGERCALAIDNARLHHQPAGHGLSDAPVGLALVDRDLRFVRVNETFAAFNDRPVRELAGGTCPKAAPTGHSQAEVVRSTRTS